MVSGPSWEGHLQAQDRPGMLFLPYKQAPSHRRIRELRSPDRPHNELVERRASAQPSTPPPTVMWPHGVGRCWGRQLRVLSGCSAGPGIWQLQSFLLTCSFFFSFYLNKEFPISVQFLNPSVYSNGTGTFQTRLTNHSPEYQMSGFLVRGQGPV